MNSKSIISYHALKGSILKNVNYFGLLPIHVT